MDLLSDYSCCGFTTYNPIQTSPPLSVNTSYEWPIKPQQPILVTLGLSAGQYLQFVSQHPFQGQQGDMCGGRIGQCCNPLLSKCALSTTVACETHSATLPCCNRLREVIGSLYSHILTISHASARKGSVSCGGLSMLCLSVPHA